ncbi:MAG TPA: hypothetical protein PLR94_11165, partial [Accumulibacter sp.]
MCPFGEYTAFPARSTSMPGQPRAIACMLMFSLALLDLAQRHKRGAEHRATAPRFATPLPAGRSAPPEGGHENDQQ